MRQAAAPTAQAASPRCTAAIRALRGFGAAALAAVGSAPALAHALAPRYDLPLPLWHYLGGAAASVALSFLVVALARRPLRPMAVTLETSAGAALARGWAGLLRALGVAALVLLLAAGLFGPVGDWDANLLPVTVWVLWWVGMAFACALAGGLWRVLDPWQAIARGVGALGGRRVRQPLRRAFAGGCGPAVVLFLAFAWTELVWGSNAHPRALAALVLAWSALAWAGMALMGPAAWRRRCDPFDRFFGLLGRLAPLSLHRRAAGWAVTMRWPGAALLQGRLPSRSETAFIIVMLATVGFDGVKETPAWEAFTAQVLALLYAAGVVHAIGYAAAGSLVKTAGLLLAPLAWAAVYLVFCALSAPLAGEPAGRVARRFALSLVPIALAYHLAHYLSYLLIQGHAGLPPLSDPFGLGWDLFGTRGREIDIGIIEMRTVWAVAVASIVLGHVIAVVVAHIEAQRAYGARALRSQVPLLVLMIAYTAFSLWILSQPIVEAG